VHGDERGKIDLPKVDNTLLNQMRVPVDLFERDRGNYYKRLSELQFKPQLTSSESGVGLRLGVNQLFIALAPFRDGFSRFDLSHGVKEYLKKVKDSKVKAAQKTRYSSDYIKEQEESDTLSYIVDWDLSTKSLVVMSSEAEYQRIELNEGISVGLPMSNAKGLYNGVSYSNESNGWLAYSYCNDAHTGGYSSCIMLEKINGNCNIIGGFGELSDNADPLALNVIAGKAHVLYGAGDSISLVEVDLASGRGSDKAKTKKTKEWKFASRFGKSLCDHKSGYLFVPNASGFEVWRIWQEKPTKRFDLVLGEDDKYAVLLQNGNYAGSPGCESLLRLKAGNGTVDASSLAPWRNRPAEVLKALGGDPEQIEILAKMTERWLKRVGHDSNRPEPTAEEIPILSVEMPPLWAKGPDIEVPIKITPQKSPVSNVSVRVNGVECANVMGQYLTKTNDGNLETVVSLRIAEGQNWIEVTAIDEMGRWSDSQRFRTILKETQSPRRYVVALGVSKYQKSEFDLAFAAKDAKDLTSSLSNTDTESLILTDNEVDGDALGKIQEFLAASQEDDEVILFCAGHGVLDANLDYVFARHDFDPDNPNETGIKLDDLILAVGAGKSLKRLILLDTCHSGLVGEKEETLIASADFKLPEGVRSIKQRGMIVSKAEELTSGAKQRFIEEMFLLPGTHRGVNIIGASGGAEYALESGQWNNGVFTASVIEGLRDKKADWDKDEDVSVSELRDYLGQRIPELTGNAQKPSVVAFERDQDFVLAR
jgi:hypothetical protein